MWVSFLLFALCVQIANRKLDWKVESRIGSLDNAQHKPGGGDKKVSLEIYTCIGNLRKSECSIAFYGFCTMPLYCTHIFNDTCYALAESSKKQQLLDVFPVFRLILHVSKIHMAHFLSMSDFEKIVY